MGGKTLTSTTRWRAAIAILAVSALTACGSTINRPNQVAISANGGSTQPAGTEVTVAGAATPGTDASGGTVASTPSQSSSGATATSAAAATGPIPTGPIEIGFLTTATSNAAAFGASIPTGASEADIIQAIVRQTNAAGGINGRKIVPVIQPTDTGSNSWDADMANACATFTEDHHVEAVVGRIHGLFDSLESCLTKHKIPHLAAAPETFDEQFLGQYPYLVNPVGITFAQRTKLKVDYGIAAGLLSPADKIGIVFAGCPAAQRSWDGFAKPYFASKGLNVAAVFATGCPHGANDASAEVGKIGNLILQFRSAGVDKVLFHSDDTAGLFVVANAAEAQGYRPKYVITSLGSLAVTGTQIPMVQRPNVTGWGWMPTLDVLQANWPAPNPAATACLGYLRAEGINASTAVDFSNAYWACDTLSLFGEAVTASGGRTDGPSVTAAIEAVGPKHVSASTYDGTSSYGRGHHTGPVTAYPFSWNTDCKCYRYQGAKVTIPTG